MINENNVKSNFEKPTVTVVFEMMQKAAKNHMLDDWRDVHALIGISERTFRRWKQHVDTQPNKISPIGFQGYALLYAVAEQKPYIQPIECDVSKIPAHLIMCAEQFNGLKTDEIRSIIGLKGLTKTGIKVIAQNVGISPNELSKQTLEETLTFGTWAMILQLCGVPIDKILYSRKDKE